MFATLVVGSFLFQGADGSAGGDAVIPYTIMGAFVLLIAVVFARVKLPEIVHDNDNDTKQGAHNLKMSSATAGSCSDCLRYSHTRWRRFR